MKKTQKTQKDPQEVANEVYNTLGQAVFKAVDKAGYLKEVDTVYATAYSLVSLAADLLKEATSMDESSIFTNLAEVLADSLDIEFKVEDEVESNEKQSVLDLPKEKKSKKMLN